MADLPPELRQIPFAEGYFVSRDGRVFSDWSRDHRAHGTVREIRCRPNDAGYYLVDLLLGGRRLTMRVHRLVCGTFNGPPPAAGLDVRHKDDIRTNNAAYNLEWGTRKQNIADMWLRGRHWLQRSPQGFTPAMRRHMSEARRTMLAARPELIRRGSRHHAALLTEATVVAIRARVAAGERQCDVAADLGLSPQLVNDIHRRRRWTHV